MDKPQVIKAYLVDLDGTLADTSEANFRAYAAALAEVGVEVARETFDRIAFGRNWRQFLPTLMGESDCRAEPADVARRKTAIYRETIAFARFNEALVLMLRHRAPGVQVALVTTASTANVDSVLAQRPDIADLFTLKITGDDVSRHKPDPEAYQLAADRLGLMPRECVVIEDSDIGTEAGRAFGASVLRVSMG